MNVELVHRLEFFSDARPTIAELQNMIAVALNDGFPDDTPVNVRADDSQKDGYWFKALIERPRAVGGREVTDIDNLLIQQRDKHFNEKEPGQPDYCGECADDGETIELWPCKPWREWNALASELEAARKVVAASRELDDHGLHNPKSAELLGRVSYAVAEYDRVMEEHADACEALGGKS